MSMHVIVGAGPVGTTLADHLVARGDQVRLISKSGRGRELDGVERVATDASDAERLARLCDGADALYNCANPTAYHRWATEWPPMAAALLSAARRSGAVLVTTGNLYPYGPRLAPMTEDSPDRPNGVKSSIRATMTADAMRAHQAGELRAVEVRASDYVGVGAFSHLNRVLPAALRGKSVSVIGDPSVPHSWTYVPDLAAALALTAITPDTWGRVWLAPTHGSISQRTAVDDICRAADRKPVKVRSIPGFVVRGMGLVMPTMRELGETLYQFQQAYVVDSSVTEKTLGITRTPWETVCRSTAEFELSRLS